MALHRSFWQLLSGRKVGSSPDRFDDVVLDYNPNYETNYQDTWTWPWAPAPAHEQRSALVNCWTGNQLPGMVNFIPGVDLSKMTWNHPTFYQNSPAGYSYKIGNKQYNVGRNIQTSSSIQSSQWQVQAYQAWLNRPGPTL
jgi:hypothetical protein